MTNYQEKLIEKKKQLEQQANLINDLLIQGNKLDEQGENKTD